MTLVVDASVMTKWFYPEAGSREAGMLLDGDLLLAAPAHASAEVGHVLTRRVREGLLTLPDMQDALHAITRSVVLIPLAELHDAASAVAIDTGASFYDALYVAAATRWNARAVTADLRLLRMCAATRWASVLVDLAAWTAQT